MSFDWRAASAGELLSRVEEGTAEWLRAEGGDGVQVRVLGIGFRQSIRIVMTRGGEEVSVFMPDEIVSVISDLREKQVVAGWGAWTWCRLWMVAGEWVLHQECDWMREPVLEGPAGGRPPPGICALELELYPRDAENIPGWMAEGVAANERRKAANARRREARRAKKEKERERQAAKAQAAEAASQEAAQSAVQDAARGVPGAGQAAQGGGGAGGSAG
ncbi:hypothetical protein [Actinomyces lilanjuaniae]|uniref:hypothetical protein n=1 Tax=Actinomyces lilanjuaniae TaxID=2321394 RepID=UPI0019690C54|nr:hypothetical protein [Actinomyces lilanjuaniae]